MINKCDVKKNACSCLLSIPQSMHFLPLLWNFDESNWLHILSMLISLCLLVNRCLCMLHHSMIGIWPHSQLHWQSGWGNHTAQCCYYAALIPWLYCRMNIVNYSTCVHFISYNCSIKLFSPDCLHHMTFSFRYSYYWLFILLYQVQIARRTVWSALCLDEVTAAQVVGCNYCGSTRYLWKR